MRAAPLQIRAPGVPVGPVGGSGYQARPRGELIEPPTAGDLIGALFRDLRRALRLSLPEAAARAGAQLQVIEALEAGDVRRLPAWHETARVVARYTELAGIDPRPVLGVIRNELEAERRTLDLAPAGREATPAPAGRVGGAGGMLSTVVCLASGLRWALRERRLAARDVRRLAAGRRGTQKRRRTIVGIAITLPFAFALSFAETGVRRAVASVLPERLVGIARTVDAYMLRTTETVRNGMLWIDADDPRSRKGDKLQTKRR